MSDKSSHGVFFLDLLLFVDITNHFLWSDYTIAKHRLQVGILRNKLERACKKEVDSVYTLFVLQKSYKFEKIFAFSSYNYLKL